MNDLEIGKLYWHGKWILTGRPIDGGDYIFGWELVQILQKDGKKVVKSLVKNTNFLSPILQHEKFILAKIRNPPGRIL